jgi:predicted  nucleic acid-binding Zn-ribbon protein
LLDKIAALIRNPEPSSAELRHALAAIDVGAATSHVDRLEADRQRLLLRPDSDKELEQIEAQIRAGNRAVERQCAVERELQRLISQVTARETEQALEATSAEAKTAKARLDRLSDELTALATTIARKIGEAEQEIGGIRAVNRKLAAAGRPDLQTKVPDIALWKHQLKAYVR